MWDWVTKHRQREQAEKVNSSIGREIKKKIHQGQSQICLKVEKLQTHLVQSLFENLETIRDCACVYVCGSRVCEVGKVVGYEVVSRNWRTRKTTLLVNVIFILYYSIWYKEWGDKDLAILSWRNFLNNKFCTVKSVF